MLRRQRHASRPLQLAVFNQGGDPPVEGAGVPLASHGVDELQLVGKLLQIVALRQAGDQRLISQFPGLPDAIHQDDALEFFPDLEILQDR
ncbi:hypothetical protein D3C76_845260 [compost metagenome]